MYYYKCSKKKNILKTRRDCSCVFLPAKSPQINVPQNGVFVLASTLEKMLNNNPSVAMEYKILGNGNKVPIMLEKQKTKIQTTLVGIVVRGEDMLGIVCPCRRRTKQLREIIYFVSNLISK